MRWPAASRLMTSLRLGMARCTMMRVPLKVGRPWQISGVSHDMFSQLELYCRPALPDFSHNPTMVLYLGRRTCGLTLRELAQAVGLRNYALVATNTKRYAQRLQSDPRERARSKQVSQLLDCEM